MVNAGNVALIRIETTLTATYYQIKKTKRAGNIARALEKVFEKATLRGFHIRVRFQINYNIEQTKGDILAAPFIQGSILVKKYIVLTGC